jgi:hypothetical protein
MMEMWYRILLVVPLFERHVGDLLVTVDRRYAAPTYYYVGMATTRTTTMAIKYQLSTIQDVVHRMRLYPPLLSGEKNHRITKAARTKTKWTNGAVFALARRIVGGFRANACHRRRPLYICDLGKNSLTTMATREANDWTLRSSRSVADGSSPSFVIHQASTLTLISFAITRAIVVLCTMMCFPRLLVLGIHGRKYLSILSLSLSVHILVCLEAFAPYPGAIRSHGAPSLSAISQPRNIGVVSADKICPFTVIRKCTAGRVGDGVVAHLFKKRPL